MLVAAAGLIGMFVLYGQAVVARTTRSRRRRRPSSPASSEASLYTNRIALADRYRQAHDADRADELLDECPVALRDWEWRYLKRRHFEDVTVYPDHEGPVHSVALSPDGRYLVSVDIGQTIHVRDRATGRVLELPGLPVHHSAVALSPDGQWMAVGGDLGDLEAGVIKLWSTKTWSEVKSLPFVGSMPHALAFSPDSRRLVAGHEDDTVRVWDVATGTLRTLSGHKKAVEDVAFSPDGRLIASASRDTTIRIWDAETYELRATLPHERPVFSLAFHPRRPAARQLDGRRRGQLPGRSHPLGRGLGAGGPEDIGPGRDGPQGPLQPRWPAAGHRGLGSGRPDLGCRHAQ